MNGIIIVVYIPKKCWSAFKPIFNSTLDVAILDGDIFFLSFLGLHVHAQLVSPVPNVR